MCRLNLQPLLNNMTTFYDKQTNMFIEPSTNGSIAGPDTKGQMDQTKELNKKTSELFYKGCIAKGNGIKYDRGQYDQIVNPNGGYIVEPTNSIKEGV